MDKHSLPSIEKFAAFLDGNLSQDEMEQFSQLAERDETLHQLIDASTEIDDTIASFSDADLQLPPEITDSSFEIPKILTDETSRLITLTPESTDDFWGAFAACADEDISQIAANIPDDNISLPESTDNSVNLMQDNDGFESEVNLSSSLPEDM